MERFLTNARGSGLLFSLLLALAFSMPAIDRGLGQRPGETIEIGAVYNLSGSQASLDRASLKGARMAVEEVNRSGGVSGRLVTLVEEADGASETGAVSASTQALLDKHPRLVGLIGLSDTDQVLAAAPVAASHERLFLTSGATSPKLPSAVPVFLFLACFGDNVQAAAAAEWAYRDGAARQVAIVANDTMSYTRLLRDYFAARFMELGGSIVSVESFGPGGLESAVASLEAADLVYAPVSPDEVVQAIDLLRATGFDGPILGGDGYDLGSVWEDNAQIGNVFFTTHAFVDSSEPRMAVFRAAYLARFPGTKPDAFTALGYDAARLLIDAIRRAGGDDPEEVRRALAETRGFDGVSGTISFRDGSHIPEKSVSILRVERGRLSLVRQLTAEKVPPP